MTASYDKWWQTGVIYQIYPRSFMDSNGDGIGDLQGIIDKLDYLNNGTPDSLGIDAIWMNPIFPSPMADFGYDISDYRNVEAIFGDLTSFDRLITQAHQRNIRIILDFVPNHTSDQHPWFIESRLSRDNPRREWYIWRDAKTDGSPPNNWGSMFGGSAWSWDEETSQYYLHLFLDKQPDLNWRNPQVQEAMSDVLRFWLDRGVDGFRMDVASYIIKDDKFRDNPPIPKAEHVPSNDLWGQQEHIFDVHRPEVQDILRQFRHLFDSYGDRITIGEVWAESREQWATYFGEKLDGLHLPFNFDLLFKPWDAQIIRESVDELEAILPEGAWGNYVLGSHDVSRLATRFGRRSVRVAAMLLLTLRGTPTIYMGEELGMIDGVISLDQIQDPQGLNLGADRSRDVCRTPFQWSDDRYAGFSTVTPWLPIADGYTTCNVKQQQDDATSILNLYKRLIDLRKNTPALNRGIYQPIDSTSENCFAYQREYKDQQYLVILNFSDVVQNPLFQAGQKNGELVLSTELDCQDTVELNNITLRANEGVIIKMMK